MKWEIHKFGGSSLASSDAFSKVAELIKDGQAVVLSAIGGVTDKLQSLIDDAIEKRENETIEELRELHLSIHRALVLGDNFSKYLEADLTDLKDLVRSIRITGTCSEEMKELILGYGEIWSTRIMEDCFHSKNREVRRIDARDVLVIETKNTGISVLWELSREKLEQKMEGVKGGILIITGFIASTLEGHPTTLKRNGSDLSAAIFAALLNSTEIYIWTDVDGIFSADPRMVPNAIILDEISYLEALELAYFGAKILHPGTIHPAMENNIGIIIKNTFHPEGMGTRILSNPQSSPNSLIKGIATIEDISLLTLEGTGMIGVPGIARKLFTALSEENISVIMISQGSSEYSICVAIRSQDSKRGQKAIEKAFAYEALQGEISSVRSEDGCGILSVVGDNMVRQQGIASILFQSLARARINVRMISQGSSERNISVVLDGDDMVKALRSVHSAFYLSHLTISVGVIGIGLIGGALVNQIAKQYNWLKDILNIDIKINAISNSKCMLIQPDIDLETWRFRFYEHGEDYDLTKFESAVDNDHIPHAVIIDCTASETIASKYKSWLSRGIHVITPNKRASSGSLEYFSEIHIFTDPQASVNPLERSTHYFYETTVGAALPIISTLKDLIKTGDQIIEIEGILSGTISYIFNQMATGARFSEIIKDAKDKGYTEPDPRDDLSGMDFTRKLVILAREAGFNVELKDVELESLISESLFEGSVEDFLEKVSSEDDRMSKLNEDAHNKGESVRYVGRISSDGKCSLQLKNYPLSHPFSNLKGSENIVLFKTRRYHEYPLVVQGPGAGADVTASGIFAELLRLANMLGNK